MISKATLGRLPIYLKYLRSVNGSVTEISATTLSRGLNLGEVQVRKDLAAVCGSGRPKIGYKTKELIQSIENILSEKEPKEAVIIGAGKLGMALLDYTGFSEYGLRVIKAFDIDPTKCNEDVLPMNELHSYCLMHQIELGILAVKPESAQEAVNEMVKSGIRAIWSFSSQTPEVPQGVIVQYENLALSLAHLHNRMKNEAI